MYKALARFHGLLSYIACPGNRIAAQKIYDTLLNIQKCSIHTSFYPNAYNFLVKDNDWTIRNMVARRTKIPKEFLKILSTDESWQTRLSVATNPSTPIDTLLLLCADKDYLVREAAHRALASCN